MAELDYETSGGGAGRRVGLGLICLAGCVVFPFLVLALTWMAARRSGDERGLIYFAETLVITGVALFPVSYWMMVGVKGVRQLLGFFLVCLPCVLTASTFGIDFALREGIGAMGLNANYFMEGAAGTWVLAAIFLAGIGVRSLWKRRRI